MSNTYFIETPPDFSFRATIYSHGWCDLLPFQIDEENWTLSYVFTAGERGPAAVPATISETENGIKIDAAFEPSDPEKMLRDVRHLLRLDDDLTGLYRSVDNRPGLEWVAEKRAGRLLRSPTVFEDLVKTICTTNCSWALTKNMVRNLVEKLGVPAPSEAPVAVVGESANGRRGSHNAFPTPAAMASVDASFYRDEVRAGYRSPYFVELAEAVAAGRLEPESWLTSPLPTPELKKEIKKVKGVGDYAAENLLKLLGRYDGLALDSWLRSQFYKKHNAEKPCKDSKIHRHYRRHGQWAGLVIWCDMTEKWIA